MIFYKPLHPLSVVRFDPVTDILTILAIAGAGAGVGSIISGMGSTPKAPDQAALPDPNKAAVDAQATQANQRRILLTSGGQTDYTGGTGVLTGSDVSKTTLLGGG